MEKRYIWFDTGAGFVAGSFGVLLAAAGVFYLAERLRANLWQFGVLILAATAVVDLARLHDRPPVAHNAEQASTGRLEQSVLHRPAKSAFRPALGLGPAPRVGATV